MVKVSSQSGLISWSQSQHTSADGSADSLPSIQLANLTQGTLFKLLWPAYSSCLLCKLLCGIKSQTLAYRVQFGLLNHSFIPSCGHVPFCKIPILYFRSLQIGATPVSVCCYSIPDEAIGAALKGQLLRVILKPGFSTTQGQLRQAVNTTQHIQVITFCWFTTVPPSTASFYMWHWY